MKKLCLPFLYLLISQLLQAQIATENNEPVAPLPVQAKITSQYLGMLK